MTPEVGMTMFPSASMVPVSSVDPLGWNPPATSLSSAEAGSPLGPATHWGSARSIRPSASLSKPSEHSGSGRGVRSNGVAPRLRLPDLGMILKGPGVATFCASAPGTSTPANTATDANATNARPLSPNLDMRIPPGTRPRHVGSPTSLCGVASAVKTRRHHHSERSPGAFAQQPQVGDHCVGVDQLVPAVAHHTPAC